MEYHLLRSALQPSTAISQKVFLNVTNYYKKCVGVNSGISKAVRALKGLISNRIDNAKELASTRVYYRHAYKREPTDHEWRRYTEELARKKN